MSRQRCRMIGRLLCCLAFCGGGGLFAAPADKPNIVMVIADDQTYRDFGFMGNPRVQTPNIDRLASRSARYVNGYVPTSVCSPSLATLLTGLYPHQHGIHYNHPPPGNTAFKPGDASSLRHPERDIAYRWVRRGDYKLIVPHGEKGKAWGNYLSGAALFDLAQDAGETHNLIGKNEGKAGELNRLLDEWWLPGRN